MEHTLRTRRVGSEPGWLWVWALYWALGWVDFCQVGFGLDGFLLCWVLPVGFYSFRAGLALSRLALAFLPRWLLGLIGFGWLWAGLAFTVLAFCGWFFAGLALNFGFSPSWLWAGLAFCFCRVGFGLGWVGFGLAGLGFLPSWLFAGLAFCWVGFLLGWLWAGLAGLALSRVGFLLYYVGWLSLCWLFAGLFFFWWVGFGLQLVGSGLWILPSWLWAGLAGLALVQIGFWAGWFWLFARLALCWVGFGLACFGFFAKLFFAGLALGQVGWFGFGSGWFLSWVGFGLTGFGFLLCFAWHFAGWLWATLAGLAFTALAFCWVGFGPGWLELWILPSIDFGLAGFGFVPS